MTKMSFRERKGPAQGHIASQQRSRDSVPNSDQNCLRGAGPSVCSVPLRNLTKQTSTGDGKPLANQSFRKAEIAHSPGRRASSAEGGAASPMG